MSIEIMKDFKASRNDEDGKEWYEDIPNQGYLCRVRDNYDSEWVVDVVFSYDEDYGSFIAQGDCSWGYAERLTNDEIKSYLVSNSDNWTDNVSRDKPIDCYVSDSSIDDALEDGFIAPVVSFIETKHHKYYQTESGPCWKYAVPVNE